MLLHRGGVPVVVPDPSRYAVRKLIVASRRNTDGQGPAKREKDVRQAALLFGNGLYLISSTIIRRCGLGNLLRKVWD